MMKKIIVFGYNNLSFEVIHKLDQGTDELIVVETNPDSLLLAEEKGFQTKDIDFKQDDNLKIIGIGRNVDTIFCFLNEESNNIFLTLSARAMDKKLNIIAIAESSQAAEKLIAAGANKIINPYKICGQKFYNLLKKPEITHIIERTIFGRHDLHIAEINITKNSRLKNTYLSELALKSTHNLLVIGIIDNDHGEILHFILGEKDHKLTINDIILILGSSREIQAFKEEISYA